MVSVVPRINVLSINRPLTIRRPNWPVQMIEIAYNENNSDPKRWSKKVAIEIPHLFDPSITFLDQIVRLHYHSTRNLVSSNFFWAFQSFPLIVMITNSAVLSSTPTFLFIDISHNPWHKQAHCLIGRHGDMVIIASNMAGFYNSGVWENLFRSIHINQYIL